MGLSRNMYHHKRKNYYTGKNAMPFEHEKNMNITFMWSHIVPEIESKWYFLWNAPIMFCLHTIAHTKAGTALSSCCKRLYGMICKVVGPLRSYKAYVGHCPLLLSCA